MDVGEAVAFEVVRDKGNVSGVPGGEGVEA